RGAENPQGYLCPRRRGADRVAQAAAAVDKGESSAGSGISGRATAGARIAGLPANDAAVPKAVDVDRNHSAGTETAGGCPQGPRKIARDRSRLYAGNRASGRSGDVAEKQYAAALERLPNPIVANPKAAELLGLRAKIHVAQPDLARAEMDLLQA